MLGLFWENEGWKNEEGGLCGVRQVEYIGEGNLDKMIRDYFKHDLETDPDNKDPDLTFKHNNDRVGMDLEMDTHH